VDRYRFTLLDPKGSEFDFRVGEFPSAEHALQLAELIACDLSLDPKSKWSGWSIEVRNAKGRTMSTISIPDGQLAAQ
jgi:hypothetical protein